jgi:hypothetical protein
MVLFTLNEQFISMRCYPTCTRPTALSGFLIVLAHGINNPLVAMLLHSHTLLIPSQSAFVLTP